MGELSFVYHFVEIYICLFICMDFLQLRQDIPKTCLTIKVTVLQYSINFTFEVFLKVMNIYIYIDIYACVCVYKTIFPSI